MRLKRFYAKELLSFREVELEFEKGLTVFTGASGAGKTVLMEGILSVFGYKEPKALNAQVDMDGNLDALEDMGIIDDEQNSFRYLKKDKVRYFINSNSVSKKDLNRVAKLFSFYLSSKENGDFSDSKLLDTLDSLIEEREFAFKKEEYKAAFERLLKLQKELSTLWQKSIRAAEEREFLEFELKKFAEIDPKEGEEDELLLLKKEISKKEKIGALLSKTHSLEAKKQAVLELFEFLGRSDEIVHTFFSELQEANTDAEYKLSRLDSIDVDAIFERLEKLSYLNKRYGGIKEAVEYFTAKKQELDELNNLDSRLSSLELDIKNLQKIVAKLADELSEARRRALPLFYERLLFFAKKLLIQAPCISLTKKELSILGGDGVELRVGDSFLSTISSGEHRRLRLALMACERGTRYDSGGVLFLDEADANLSGEESAGVAYLLRELSKNYQIFAISHQPQLASVADNHYLVTKDESGSFVQRLDESQRVDEIARMVSSGDITKEALEYAKKMLKEGAWC